MNRTKIEWCDYTWNPIFGCSPTSPGCDHCYAAAIAKRFRMPWGVAHFLPDRLDEPAKVKKPGRVFVGSMTDLGHHTAYPFVRAVAEAMKSAPWHTYIVLTKRPGQWIQDLPPACWVGVTIESADYLCRWGRLFDWSISPVRFVSVEPMLGPVSFAQYAIRPDWIIAGPETGPGARPYDPAWIDSLAAESPCFFDKRPNGQRREFPA